MSWHIATAGSPDAVRDELRGRFMLARNSTTSSDELRSVVAAEFMINRHLDFAVIQRVPAVTVDASGATSYKGVGFAASVITQVNVELVWGFVADPDIDVPDINENRSHLQ
jgi:hypothetical protein